MASTFANILIDTFKFELQNSNFQNSIRQKPSVKRTTSDDTSDRYFLISIDKFGNGRENL